MKKSLLALSLSFAVFAVSAETGKDAFLRQQAYAEMQRVAGQVDIIENNLSDLSARVGKLERSSGDESLKAEVAALRATVEDLKRQLANQRGEIVNDLTKRIQKAQRDTAPAPVQYKGPVKEYVVQGGDTLSLIAEAFETTVPKIKEINGLKSDMLRVGQKIRVPAK